MSQESHPDWWYFRHAVTMTAAWTGLLPCSALVGLLSTRGWCWRCWQGPWNIAAAKQHLTESHPTEGARATSSGIHSVPTDDALSLT